MTNIDAEGRLAVAPALTPSAPPRSGRLARRLGSIPPSGIRKFFDLVQSTSGVISLGVGEPDFVTPEPISRAAIASIEAGETHYTSNFGLIELRRALAEHLERLYGVRYDPAREIIITVGVSEALDIAVRATIDPGDEVIMADPSYVAYLPAIVLAGGTAVPVPTYPEQEFKLTAAGIQAAITPRTRALLLGFPNNPTGAVLERPDLEAIAAVAERHDLLVFADEIYDRLTYGVEHTCFAALPRMRDRTMLLGGFSKAYAMTGWRVGYVCAPVDLIEGMLRVHQYTIMCAPTAAQFAALEALRHGEPDVQRMVAEYDRRRRLIVKGFNEIGLPCVEPRGAFYAFPRVSHLGLTSEQFAEGLLKAEKVAVVPGGTFGARGEGFVRACYATALPQIEEALERTRRYVRSLG